MKAVTSDTPGQPVLVVGVAGHRPDGLGSADETRLRNRVRSVLLLLRKADNNATLISPIAEGADRLVAHQALAAGIPLICLLPFARDVYIKDFTTQASVEDYRALLDRAQSVRELTGVHGSDGERDTAYAALSDALVGEIHVLIAIWDGNEARGIGGTGHSVDAALRRNIPVVWIDAHPPHEVRVLTQAGGSQTAYQALGSLPALLATREKTDRSSPL